MGVYNRFVTFSMKIPDKIKVGGNIIKIVRGAYYTGTEQHDGGWLDWEQNTMFLSNDMPKDREATCFMHEILHAMNIYLKEEQVTYLSEMLMQVITDNNLDFRTKNV